MDAWLLRDILTVHPGILYPAILSAVDTAVAAGHLDPDHSEVGVAHALRLLASGAWGVDLGVHDGERMLLGPVWCAHASVDPAVFDHHAFCLNAQRAGDELPIDDGVVGLDRARARIFHRRDAGGDTRAVRIRKGRIGGAALQTGGQGTGRCETCRCGARRGQRTLGGGHPGAPSGDLATGWSACVGVRRAGTDDGDDGGRGQGENARGDQREAMA